MRLGSNGIQTSWFFVQLMVNQGNGPAFSVGTKHSLRELHGDNRIARCDGREIPRG